MPQRSSLFHIIYLVDLAHVEIYVCDCGHAMKGEKKCVIQIKNKNPKSDTDKRNFKRFNLSAIELNVRSFHRSNQK